MDKKTFYNIMKLAGRSPSGDNMQPWRVYTKNNFNSFILMAEILENDFFDINNTATFISCGCFLETLRIASLKFGFKLSIKYDLDESSLKIADVSFINFPSGKDLVSNSKLVDVINKRYICRDSFDSKLSVPKLALLEIEKELSKNSMFKVKHFSKVDCGRDEIVNTCSDADVIRFETYGAHKTFFDSLRFSKKEINSGDGMDYRTLGVNFFAKLIFKLLSKWNIVKFLIKVGAHKSIVRNITFSSLNSSNDLFFLYFDYTKKISKKDYILTGEIGQRVWLILAKYNIFVQPFASMTFLLRRLNSFSGEGFSDEQILRLNIIKNKIYDLCGPLNSNNFEPLLLFRAGVPIKKTYIKTLRKKVSDFVFE